MSKHTSASLLITGHSLGAAIASMAAVDIKRKIKSSLIIKFYTFGSPRVGNDVFADYAMTLYPNGTYSRVTHHNDAAVYLPNPPVFKHFGNEVWYQDGKQGYEECENDVGLKENVWCSKSMFW